MTRLAKIYSFVITAMMLASQTVIAETTCQKPELTIADDGTVTITCSTPGAKIYYAFSPGVYETAYEYTGPFKVDVNHRVHAVAYNDWAPSDETSAVFNHGRAPIETDIETADDVHCRVRELSHLPVATAELIYIELKDGVAYIPDHVTINGETYEVTRIGNDAVSDKGDCAVHIPPTIKTVGSEAFIGSTIYGTYITDLRAFAEINFDGFEASPLKNEHPIYLDGNAVTDLVIPEGTKMIGSYAFCNYKYAQTVTLPSSVKSINSCGFTSCSNITTVRFAEGLRIIGAMAFFHDSALETVYIPASVEVIYSNAFGLNPELKNVICAIPDPAEKRIDNYIFSETNEDWILVVPKGSTEKYVSVGFCFNHIINEMVSFNDIFFYSSEPTLHLRKGQTHQLHINTYSPLPNGDPVDFIYTYTSGNTQVVTVDEDGLVTAVGTGKATIAISVGADPTPLIEIPVEVVYEKCPITEFGYDGDSWTMWINTDAEDASIYYTLDGSIPSPENGIHYTGNTEIDHNCEIRVLVVAPYYMNSDIFKATLNARCKSPEIILDGNTVTMANGYADDVIYYTINGSDPSYESLVYTGPIEVDMNCRILAFATNDKRDGSYASELEVSTFANPRTFKYVSPDGTLMYFKELSTKTASLTLYKEDGAPANNTITVPATVEYDGTTYTVTGIGASAFREVPSDTYDISLPPTLTCIDRDAFYGTRFRSVHITDLDAWLNIYFLNESANPLVHGLPLYLNGEQIVDLVVPDGITEIRGFALRGCSGIRSVRLPQSITTIGTQSFAYCSDLTSIELPSSVKKLGSESLNSLPNLQSISLPDSITELPYGVFANCHRLSEVKLPANLQKIGWGAFSDCVGLSAFTVPEGVKTIEGTAFMNCNSLKSLHLPSSLVNIGERAFGNTSSLKSVYIDLESLDGVEVRSDAFSNIYQLATLYTPYPEIYHGTYMPWAEFAFIKDYDKNAANEVFISELRVELLYRQSYKLNATIVPYTASPEHVVWTSSDEKVVTVDADGTISDVAPGDATIRVALASNTDIYDECKVTVRHEKLPTPSFEFRSDSILDIHPLFDGVTIRYTIGEDLYPDESSDIFTSPLHITKNVMVRARTYRDHYLPSEIAEFRSNLTCSTPVISVEGDTVTITTESRGATIMYSRGGQFYHTYTGPFKIDFDDVIYAYAMHDDLNTSELAERHVTGYGNPREQEITIDGCTLVFRQISYEEAELEKAVSVPNGYALHIPETVMMGNDDRQYTVRRIADGSFWDSYEFDLHLPSTLREIGANPFMNTRPRGVHIDNISHWLDLDFLSNASNLINECGLYIDSVLVTNVDIPMGISRVKQYAFYGYEYLERVTVPSSVSVIEQHAFDNSSLSEVILSEGLTRINTDAFRSTRLAYVDIPSTVTEIESAAFYSCENLKAVKLPEKLRTIHSYTFGECTNIEKVFMPLPGQDKLTAGEGIFTVFRAEAIAILYVPRGCSGNYHRGEGVYSYDFKDIAEIDFDTTAAIVINRDDIAMMSESDLQLYAVMMPIAGDQQLVWTSSDETVATVSADGTVHALNQGQAEITVCLADNTEISDHATVKVTNLQTYPMPIINGYFNEESRSYYIEIQHDDISGSHIYYTTDGQTPTENSTPYIAPFVINDCITIKAIGKAPGYMVSDVAEFTPTDVPISPLMITYDGRYATVHCEVPDVTYRFTIDGSDPHENSELSYGEIDLFGLNTLRVYAVKDNMQDSPVSEFTPGEYFNGHDLFIAADGDIDRAFGWCDGVENSGEIYELLVRGYVNQHAIDVIKSMKVAYADMRWADLANKDLPARAFAGMPMLGISLPADITSIGESTFHGCNNLAAVVWDARVPIPANALDGIDNPNLLLYVQQKSLAPTTVANIVAGGNAERIEIVDGYNYFCPFGFTAAKASYSHDYTMTTWLKVCSGWEAIALPFDVQRIEHQLRGEIAPFAADRDDTKPFWLYSLTDDGYKPADRMRALTPYLISMPNDEHYIDEYILAGKVTFMAENVELPSTLNHVAPEYNGWRFDFALHRNNDTNNVWTLNVGEEYNDMLPGSVFVNGLRPAAPFEAYLRDISSKSYNMKRVRELIGELSMLGDIIEADGLRISTRGSSLRIESDDPCTVRIHTINGLLVREIKVDKGLTVISDLIDGIYLVNNHKVVIR